MHVGAYLPQKWCCYFMGCFILTDWVQGSKSSVKISSINCWSPRCVKEIQTILLPCASNWHSVEIIQWKTLKCLKYCIFHSSKLGWGGRSCSSFVAAQWWNWQPSGSLVQEQRHPDDPCEKCLPKAHKLCVCKLCRAGWYSNCGLTTSLCASVSCL